MSRQLQSLLMALQVAQLVYAAATTSSSSSSSIRHHPLPMELYEVAHSHKGAHSDAISLHDLLIKEDHFQERSHPMSQLATGTDDEKQIPLGSRRHRKAAGRRQNHRQGRQMGTLESQSQQQPTVYYVAGVSQQIYYYYYFLTLTRIGCKCKARNDRQRQFNWIDLSVSLLPPQFIRVFYKIQVESIVEVYRGDRSIGTES